MAERDIRLDRIKAAATIFVVLVHASNLYTYAQKESDLIQFLGLFSQMGVPLFFMVSGYLAGRQYRVGAEWYLTNIKKKTKSLMGPYLIWCLFYWMIERLVIQHGANISIQTILFDIVGIPFWKSPVYGLLWFVRDLYLITFLLPAFKKITRSTLLTLIWFVVVWFFPVSYAFQQTFAWYVAGVFVCEKKEQLQSVFMVIRRYLLLFIGIGVLGNIAAVISRDSRMGYFMVAVCVIIFWSSFTQSQNTNSAIMYLLDRYIAPSSFIIFVIHGKILSLMQQIYIKVLGTKEVALLLGYFLLPTVVVLFCVLADHILRRTPIYTYLTGSRT